MKKYANLVLVEKDKWLGSEYAVARYSGKVDIGGVTFLLLSKDGKDFYQMSVEAAVDGKMLWLDGTEPIDLVRADFVKAYRRLGRRKFVAILKGNKDATIEELKEIFKYVQTDYKPADGCQVMR